MTATLTQKNTNPVKELAYQPTAFIDGKWHDFDPDRTFQVLNPATNEPIQDVLLSGARETTLAIEAAARALPAWAALSAFTRANYLMRLVELLQEYREPLARLAVFEQGMPLAGNRGGVDYAISFFRWFAEEARRIYGRVIAHPDPTRHLRVEYEPCGVAGIITPWNGPLGSPAKKVAAALAAGCTVVIKPSEFTPLSALALAWLCQKAEIPAGVVNVVCGDTPAIGKALLEHPAVRVISFTGSLRTGRYLYTEAAKSIKRVALELGGNAPFIICADADLDRAVEDMLWLKQLCAGQICVGPNRVYIESSIFNKAMERIVARCKATRVGSGFDDKTEMGPLIHHAAAERMVSLVEEARAQGAQIHCGGNCQPPDSNFFLPTVVTGMKPESRLLHEEIFGPILPVMPFDNEEEVIKAANATDYRLSAYVYTTNLGRAQRMGAQLKFGVVGINDPRPVTCEAPFGGMGLSGIGREGGTEGLADFLECKLIGTRA